jgi:L-asparagine transporter-like permease
MANVAALLLYLLCCAAAWQLTRRDVRTDGRPFEFPGARFIPIIAIAFIVWILAHATAKEFSVLGAVLVVGSGLFLISRMIARTSISGGARQH